MTNRIFFKIILCLALSGSSYLVYTNYNRDNHHIITIYPDPSPTKIKPQNIGGVIIPNSNNIIYENLQQRNEKNVGKVVTLQPEPEQPLNITVKQPGGNHDTDSIDEILFNIVETDHNKNDLNKAQVNGQQITMVEDGGQSNPITNQLENKTGLNIIKITQSHRNIDKTTLLNSASYRIQLALVRSEPEARQEAERIKKKYAKTLNGIEVTIKKEQSSKGNFFYLVLAGNYQNVSQAKAICKKLSDHQQGCIITNY